jgi:N-methylhydantoinase A
LQRDTLNVGAEVAGPAVIDQLDTTLFIRPSWIARVDRDGNLIATHSGKVSE